MNLNTVARAYRLLEEEGFVVIRSRAGVQVAAPAARPAEATRERLLSELSRILARMRQVGILPEEIRRLAEREIFQLEGSRASTL